MLRAPGARDRGIFINDENPALLGSAQLQVAQHQSVATHLGAAASGTRYGATKIWIVNVGDLKPTYNKVMAGGKWSHMMDQTHIGYTSWQEPEYNKTFCRTPRVAASHVSNGRRARRRRRHAGDTTGQRRQRRHRNAWFRRRVACPRRRMRLPYYSTAVQLR
jgi:hypothetical protein